ncbi:MAG: chitin deacetylase, partial [Verrucomicrobiota bacterium]
FRFNRAPWLIEGKSTEEILRENIQLCTAAMKTRLGIEPAGFRTPGGFADGLIGHEAVQRMLLDCGFRWVSSKYPAHPYSPPGMAPTPAVLDGIVAAQSAAQPFAYPTGLIELPMSPISDVGAFRHCRWPLDHFLRAIRAGVEWAIEHRATFDLLCHPAVLYPNDPEFKIIELVCDLVKQAGERAAIVDLNTLAQRISG